MKITKYIAATAVLTALSTPVVFAQTLSCFPLPPGVTSLPPGMILPPGVVLCPVATTTTTTTAPTAVAPAPAPVVAPAPAPVVAPAPAPVAAAPVVAPAPAPAPVVAAPTSTAISGSIDEDHEGRGEKKGMDNGKKKGLHKDHENQGDHGNQLVMTGTLSGDTLTVTAISSGHLEVGTVLTGGGFTQPVKIVAFGTGHGGVGTYTVAVEK